MIHFGNRQKPKAAIKNIPCSTMLASKFEDFCGVVFQPNCVEACFRPIHQSNRTSSSTMNGVKHGDGGATGL
jgi:hypothetical protein